MLITASAAPSLAAESSITPQPAALPAVTQPTPAATVQIPVIQVPAFQPSLIQVPPASPQTNAAVMFTVPLAAPPATLAKAAPLAAVPLRDLVISFIDRRDQDAEQLCLANAVYFEARSEPLEGQLAVAQVVLNRAASGTFPTSVCEVVTQPAQFSFVHGGKLPSADKGSACWHRALAIADIARKRSRVAEVASNVLWYHATYVSPSWDRQRTRFTQIGNHIFFS